MTKPTQSSRNWQDIIKTLLDFSELEKNPNNRYSLLAKQLQALTETNGTEAEKEAVFTNFSSFYTVYEQLDPKFKATLAKDAEQARQARINREQREKKHAEWLALPFYAQDKFSEVRCIEKEQTIEDKFLAVSAMLDNIKAVPILLTITSEEENSEPLNGRIAEMAKLYVTFANEQFSQLQVEVMDRLEACNA